MTTKNFTQFNTATPLLTGDFLVGYNQAGTAELKTTVQQVANVVLAGNTFVTNTTLASVSSNLTNSKPYVEVIRSAGAGAQQRINATEYLFEWDTKNVETNTTILSGNPSNYNIVLNQTGFYEVDARYSAYDIGSGDYLLLRLRGSQTPITTFTNNLLELLDIRGFGINLLNGTATTSGKTVIRVEQVPYYLAISYQGDQGSADGGISYYTVNETTFGNIPRFRVTKISNL